MLISKLGREEMSIAFNKERANALVKHNAFSKRAIFLKYDVFKLFILRR